MYSRLVFRDFKNIGRLSSLQTDISTMKFGLSIGQQQAVKAGKINE